MGKATTILLSILIVIVIVVGYLLYTNLNKPIINVQERGFFEETEAGVGIGPYAKCPTGKKAISGGCTTSSQYLEITSSGELMKSNTRLDYYDAWSCHFTLKETTNYSPHPYSVYVNCQ